jgi:trk system potassium uptake protein TrkH
VASNPTKKNPPKSTLPLEYSAGATPAADHDPGEELVRWLFPAYIMLILVGFFVLRLRGITPSGNELAPDRAVFTAVNAATLTGFQLSIHPTGFETLGKVVLFLLMICGSMFSLVVGGLAAKRILRFEWPDRRIVVFAAALHAIVLLLGLILPTDSEHTTFGGAFRTAAALANCGLYIDVPAGAAEATTQGVLLPLAVLGGLGITVVIELWDALVHKRPLSRHARVVLGMSAGVYLSGLAGLALLQLAGSWTRMTAPISSGSGVGQMLATLLIDSSALSLDARTPGFAMLPIYNFPRAMIFFLMLLMMIGASPAGTGGGLKTTTLYELVTAPIRALRGQTISRTFGVAATWLGVYLLAVAVFHMMLLSTEPQMPGDRALFVTVSAVSNVGLSHDTLSMTRSSLFVVSAAMFTGRLVPLLILWWMADTTRDADVAIG